MDLEMGPKTDQKWAQKIYLIFIKFLSKFKIIFLFFEPNFPIGSRTSFGVVRPLTKKSHLILIWTWDALFKLWCGSSWLFCYNRHAIDLFPLRLFLRSLGGYFFKWGLDSYLFRKAGKRYRPNSLCNVIFSKFVLH